MTPRRIEAARKLLASGMPAREIAPTIGVAVATLYRHFLQRFRTPSARKTDDDAGVRLGLRLRTA
ncbi:helix-turn-helix domain-containing protein [Sphingomonas desiccabilis]|uniref:helix-turn-helix domain-containing protein n=1 Tax=Sphingomonas desiccabilis TaxID=429134 RepID=UPI001F1106D0|nr:helix-turn-helix domain-containing protein [Sphingomonas desiccabilis]